MDNYDVIVIGGGVVGLATAWALSERLPQRRVALVEKEAGLARHQTGHNSGVLHSGNYYKPGSLKAATCRAGREAMIAFCQQEGIAYELCGKVIVALDQAELGRLHGLAGRGVANGVDCELISAARLHELEPHAAGVAAIHVRDTGIVDFKQVCARLAQRLQQQGHAILTGAAVIGIEERPDGVLVRTRSQDLLAPVVVNCAGLHSDRVAALAGSRPLDDFAFAETARIIHVINAPSPAATAALSIGQFIAGKVAERTGPPSSP